MTAFYKPHQSKMLEKPSLQTNISKNPAYHAGQGGSESKIVWQSKLTEKVAKNKITKKLQKNNKNWVTN